MHTRSIFTLRPICRLLGAVALAAIVAPDWGATPAGAATVFTAVSSGLPAAYAADLEWGDYDNDGDLDVLYAYDSSPSVYRNDGGVFSNINLGLSEMHGSSAAWGDYDNDGDLDFALNGSLVNIDRGITYLSKIYNNNAGVFSDSGIGLDGVDGPLAWGDYDNDGDLDLATAGYHANGRRTFLFRNEGGSFAEAGAGLLRASDGALAWGDYDSDGDLDLVVAGNDGSGYSTTLYRNADGVLADAGAGLPGVINSALAWGDYDGDGDLDLALSGSTDSAEITRVYRNTAGVFADAGANLTGGHSSALAWGDYDNDGDLDLVAAVQPGSTRITTLYRNDGGSLIDSAIALNGMAQGETVWGDYDNDGDLDLLAAGASVNDSTVTLYRNEGSPANSVPAAPGGLSASVTSGGATLSWNASGDAQTPAAALSYNLRIGTTPGGGDVMAPHASAAGLRRLAAPGNAQHQTSWTVDGLDAGTTYYWSVQAVDSILAGSPFAGEGNFTPGVAELSVATLGAGGAVTSSPAGIDCGADCVESFAYGSVITLTATPDAGSTFLGWGGACEGTEGAACQVTIGDASAVTATFGRFQVFVPLIAR